MKKKLRIDRFLNKIHCRDCIELMKKLQDNSIDAIITDPPYGLEFMGKDWDKFKEGKNIAGGTTGLNTPFGRKRALPSFYQLKRFGRAGEEGKNDLKVKKNFRALPRFFNCDVMPYQQFTFQWATECLRVLKPGGYLLSFGGTRTYHRMACGIEDAGFEIRDCIMWVYGSGFPKSLNIGKQIDKMKGAERKIVGKGVGAGTKGNTFPLEHKYNITIPATPEAKEWDGWGTALKPAVEPIVVARKPLSEKTVAKNVLKWRTGGINIDGSRIGTEQISAHDAPKGTFAGGEPNRGSIKNYRIYQGRFPSNLILDEKAAELLDQQSGRRPGGAFPPKRGSSAFFGLGDAENRNEFVGKISDIGGASRFFYVAKASKSERNFGLDDLPDKPISINEPHNSKTLKERYEMTTKNNHPTVKPIKLMEYLIKLVIKENAIVLDPFIGSGTTAIACLKLSRKFVGIDKEPEYCRIARARIKGALNKRLQKRMI